MDETVDNTRSYQADTVSPKRAPSGTRGAVDALLGFAESQLEPIAEILISRRENGTGAEAAQPGDIVDEWGNLSAMKRASTSRVMRRMDEEEIAEFGETIADAWGYKKKNAQ